MSEDKKPLKSVLHKNKKSSIQEKHVNIAGNNDFSSITKNMKAADSDKKRPKTSTQRMDTSTLEAAKILYFFLPKKSEKSNPSFNDILNLLMDNYVDTALNGRQKEMFKQMTKNTKN